MAKTVFYSFHFDNDVMRVQQIRNMGVLDGNVPVNANEWESIKKKGDQAIKNWIQDNMAYKKAVVVLIGKETYTRRWVKYEIEKAWTDGKAVFGVYIHNLKCPNSGTCTKGSNPFIQFTLNGTNLADLVSCYDPPANDAYNYIKNNIDSWVDAAIRTRSLY